MLMASRLRADSCCSTHAWEAPTRGAEGWPGGTSEQMSRAAQPHTSSSTQEKGGQPEDVLLPRAAGDGRNKLIRDGRPAGSGAADPRRDEPQRGEEDELRRAAPPLADRADEQGRHGRSGRPDGADGRTDARGRRGRLHDGGAEGGRDGRRAEAEEATTADEQ